MNSESSTVQDADLPHRAGILRAALSVSGLDLCELWAGCVGLGNVGNVADLEAILAGSRTFTDHQYNVIAQALNDRFVDLGRNHPVPYAHET